MQHLEQMMKGLFTIKNTFLTNFIHSYDWTCKDISFLQFFITHSNIGDFSCLPFICYCLGVCVFWWQHVFMDSFRSRGAIFFSIIILWTIHYNKCCEIITKGKFFSKLNSTNVIIKVFIIMFGVDNTRGMCLLMEGLGTMMLVVSKVGIDEISCF